MFSKKMKALVSMMISLALCLSGISALACTSIYVGSDLTTDGSVFFARSEDISNSYNKLFYVSPAGKHTAGETYNGCYGYSYTFTKDSYSYTAFSDDNGDGVEGICPDCGGTHAHTPYEAGGTNQMGVSISATETIGCAEALYNADPYEDLGIEEAEIVTIVLSEAASAKEAVELLAKIYDEAGCCSGSGILIGDSSEVWYMENTTGHQYIALKLSSSMIMCQPNMSIIGLIDLDDTDNVIASEKLIQVAQDAGTYVGDVNNNTIDYVASYNADQTANARMADSLKYFNESTASAEPVNADYTISNVGEDGAVVPMYTNIKPDRAFSIEELIGYYDIGSIGYSRNLETHIFQIFPEDGLKDTVEWVSMDNASLSAFIPYYPMLTTDVYEGYKVSTASAVFTEEMPADAEIVYAASVNKRAEDGSRVSVEGYKALPENWADSFYWTMDALSNLYEFGDLTDDQIAAIDTEIASMQAQCYDTYALLQSAVANAEDDEAAAAAATQISAELAAVIHAAAVELVNGIK